MLECSLLAIVLHVNSNAMHCMCFHHNLIVQKIMQVHTGALSFVQSAARLQS